MLLATLFLKVLLFSNSFEKPLTILKTSWNVFKKVVWQSLKGF